MTAVALMVAALVAVSGLGAWSLAAALNGQPDAGTPKAAKSQKKDKAGAKAKAASQTAAPTMVSRPSAMARTTLLLLARSTLSALQQANETNNYSVLHDMGAPGFQAANDPAKLAGVFSALRASGLDLSGVVVVDPVIAMPAMIDGQGRLHVSGAFPSQPRDVTFDLVYEPVAGHWRPFGISVGTRPASPQAVVQPTAPAPTAAVGNPNVASARRAGARPDDPMDRFTAPADPSRR